MPIFGIENTVTQFNCEVLMCSKISDLKRRADWSFEALPWKYVI